jgi:hypothetical protein
VGRNILPVLRVCLHYGLDPAAVAEMLPEGRTMRESLNAIDKIVSDNPPHTTDVSHGQSLFIGIPPIMKGDWWEERVALAMILGVCPIFLLRFPQITAAALLSFISTKEEDLKTLQDSLSSVIPCLISA